MRKSKKTGGTLDIMDVAFLAIGSVAGSQITGFVQKQGFLGAMGTYAPAVSGIIGASLAYFMTGSVRQVGLGIAASGFSETVENLVLGGGAVIPSPAVPQGAVSGSRSLSMGFTPQMTPSNVLKYKGVAMR